MFTADGRQSQGRTRSIAFESFVAIFEAAAEGACHVSKAAMTGHCPFVGFADDNGDGNADILLRNVSDPRAPIGSIYEWDLSGTNVIAQGFTSMQSYRELAADQSLIP